MNPPENTVYMTDIMDLENEFFPDMDHEDNDDVLTISYMNNQLFNLSAVFGCNKTVGLKPIELRKEKQKILFTFSHIPVIMDVKTQQYETLWGHSKQIIQIDCDGNSRFLLTADSEKLLIWDRKNLHSIKIIPVCVLNNIFENDSNAIRKAAISHCGKYLVVIGDKITNKKFYELQFWLWSFGKKACDDKFYISREFGEIKSITFSENPNENEFFAITLAHNVVFGTWKTNHLQIHIQCEKTFKNITKSCYVKNSRNVLSSTGLGRILIWSDFLQALNNEDVVSNDKNYITSIRIKTNSCSINDIKMIDECLVIVDSMGEISFYNKDICLLFVCSFWKFSAIKGVFPVLYPRNFRLIDDNMKEETGGKDSDVEVILKSKCVKDLTVENEPFIVREFFIVTDAEEIYLCDIVKRSAVKIIQNFGGKVLAADINENIIYAINENSKVFAFDSMKNETISECELTTSKNVPNVLKVSPNQTYLAVGFSDGYLWFLDGKTVNNLPNSPIKVSDRVLNAIEFTGENYCAVSDENFSIILLKLVDENWTIIGKHRFHCRKIMKLCFINIHDNLKLISIGNDRFFVKYHIDFDASRKFDEKNLNMIIEQDVRLEQSANITAAQLVPLSSCHLWSKIETKLDKILLIANDEYKFKFVDLEDAKILCTLLGPIFNTPIKQIEVVSSGMNEEQEHFLIVSSDESLGAILIPIDGNPFRYSGFMVDTEKKIKSIATSFLEESIFTLVNGDQELTLWKPNKPNIMSHFKSGGEGLRPFLRLLSDSELSDQIVDLFYFIQLDVQTGESKVSDKNNIRVCDLIDFLRAVGYFPSEYEVKNVLFEAKLRQILPKSSTSSNRQIIESEISFKDVIQLYINHRPVNGYNQSKLLKAFKYFVRIPSSYNLYRTLNNIEIHDENVEAFKNKFLKTNDNFITKQKLLQILVEEGESISKAQAISYLLEILQNDVTNIIIPTQLHDIELEFEKLLPDEFNIKYLCRILLQFNDDHQKKPIHYEENDDSRSVCDAENSSITAASEKLIETTKINEFSSSSEYELEQQDDK